MTPILRATCVYVFLLVVLRASGRRTLGEMTTFDFVLLLIISEATQNAMIGNDYSLTNAGLVIITLISLDLALTFVKNRSKRLERLLDGVPTILVENGRPIPDHLKWSRVGEDDILEAARLHRGLKRMDQIQYAILECDGRITVIARDEE